MGGTGKEVEEMEGMMEGNSDGRSENTGNQSHTEESEQKSLHSGDKDIIGKASEEEFEEEEEEDFEELRLNKTNKADTLIIAENVEKRKAWRKPGGQMQKMAHGKWTSDGVWRMEKKGKTQSELLKEELKTTV